MNRLWPPKRTYYYSEYSATCGIMWRLFTRLTGTQTRRDEYDIIYVSASTWIIKVLFIWSIIMKCTYSCQTRNRNIDARRSVHKMKLCLLFIYWRTLIKWIRTKTTMLSGSIITLETEFKTTVTTQGHKSQLQKDIHFKLAYPI